MATSNEDRNSVEMTVCQNKFGSIILKTHIILLSNSHNTKENTADT